MCLNLQSLSKLLHLKYQICQLSSKDVKHQRSCVTNVDVTTTLSHIIFTSRVLLLIWYYATCNNSIKTQAKAKSVAWSSTVVWEYITHLRLLSMKSLNLVIFPSPRITGPHLPAARWNLIKRRSQVNSCFRNYNAGASASKGDKNTARLAAQ